MCWCFPQTQSDADWGAEFPLGLLFEEDAAAGYVTDVAEQKKPKVEF